jgi:hypothetical protein
MPVATEYEGVLRPKITLLPDDEGELVVQIEWLDEIEGMVIWTEKIKPRPGCAFVTQVSCAGQFWTSGGYFIDPAGRRHHVLKCEQGRLGVPFGDALAVVVPGN